MLAHRLIERKRDGGKLDPGEWRALIMAYAAGHVPDYQMAAFLMACFLKGLDRAETVALTDAMLNSGVRFELASLGKPRLDKHSIGGVGDKVSLVLAPLVSALGIAVMLPFSCRVTVCPPRLAIRPSGVHTYHAPSCWQ